MTAFVALLRAVNVGGTGKLPMTDLRAICESAGFAAVRTHIASGNVVFDAAIGETAVKQQLESRLAAYAGKPVGVLVRDAAEMAAIVAANPFPDAPPNKTAIIFLEKPAPADTPDRISGQANEQVRAGKRELYVLYPSGMGRSKLKIPAARDGTARNMNTVAKLAEMTAALAKGSET